MLNERQKQFRKQMMEFEKAKNDSPGVYSYKEQRFTGEKPRRGLKKPLLQIGGVVSLIVLLWNVYVLSSSLLSGTGVASLLSTDQLEVHRYIQESSEVEMALNKTANSLMQQYNGQVLTPFHIEEAQGSLFELQKKIDSGDARFLPINAYLNEQFKLVYQLTNVLKTAESPAKHAEINGVVDKRNELLKRRDAALASVLESEGIPYQQHEDGSISYQYEM